MSPHHKVGSAHMKTPLFLHWPQPWGCLLSPCPAEAAGRGQREPSDREQPGPALNQGFANGLSICQSHGSISRVPGIYNMSQSGPIGSRALRICGNPIYWSGAGGGFYPTSALPVALGRVRLDHSSSCAPGSLVWEATASDTFHSI